MSNAIIARPKTEKRSPLALRQQRGVVLVVSLIMLLLMTLIGVTAMQTVTLDERMAGNAHQRNIAFQTAEAGLRAGESHIQNLDWDTETTPPAGIMDHWDNSTTYLSLAALEAFSWDDNHSQVYTGTLDNRLATQPRYVIERMAVKSSSGGSLDAAGPPSTTESWYRVTARGSGNGSVGDAVVLLQSIFVN